MGKRNQGISTAVQAAKDKRQQFITAFERCDSYEQLQSVLSKYEKQKNGPLFVVPKKLKEGQARDINQLDLRITQLIMSKNSEFPPPVKEVTVADPELSSAADQLEIAHTAKEGPSSHDVSLSDQTQGDTLQPPSAHVQQDNLHGEESTLSDTHKASPIKPTFDRRDSQQKNIRLKSSLRLNYALFLIRHNTPRVCWLQRLVHYKRKTPLMYLAQQKKTLALWVPSILNKLIRQKNLRIYECIALILCIHTKLFLLQRLSNQMI